MYRCNIYQQHFDDYMYHYSYQYYQYRFSYMCYVPVSVRPSSCWDRLNYTRYVLIHSVRYTERSGAERVVIPSEAKKTGSLEQSSFHPTYHLLLTLVFFIFSGNCTFINHTRVTTVEVINGRKFSYQRYDS